MSTSLSAVVFGIALLGLLASVTAPTVQSSDQARLDTAAQELAALIRLARSEAIRLQAPHGIIYNDSNQSFQVAEVDPASEPLTVLSSTYHPVRKQPLAWQSTWLKMSPDTNVFNYGTYGDANELMFDPWGTPVLTLGGVRRLMSSSSISLSVGEQRRKVTIEAMTGRVVIVG